MKPVFQDNERCDLPSASIIERLALCAGSWRLSKGLPEILSPEMQRYADSGDRVHLYCQMPDLIDLTPWPDELEVAQECLRQRDEIIEQAFGKIPVEHIKEQRLWLYGLKAGKPQKRFSARLDFGCGPSDRYAVAAIEYKSGRGDQTESSSNLQLRSQLVLLWKHLNRKPTVGYTAVVQPLVSGKPEICRYDYDQIKEAEKELEAILDAADDPKATLNPGEKQCKFCPARLICPAAAGVLQEIHDTELTKLLGIEPKKMAAMLEKCDVADQIIKAARAHAKAHLKLDGNCIPGWKLEPNSPTRAIEDAEAAYNAMSGFGMTSEKFLKECVTVKIGGLEKATKAIAEARGEKCTAKMAKDIVNCNCAKLITEKPKEPSLERVK